MTEERSQRPAKPVDRREVLRSGSAALLATAGLRSLAQPASAGSQGKGDISVTGICPPELASFDAVMLEHMQKHALPGGALAVVREGRLVLARGYGFADREAGERVQPTSLFRLASVSKPVTGVALMLALQEGRQGLTAETRLFPCLGLKPFLKPGAQPDRRLDRITLLQVLHHSGGWDRARSGDPMFKHFEVARDMGIASPPDHASLIRWVMGQPLDFDPGTREAYSNFGYCVLGRVIEKASGQSYEAFVRARVLRPLGITAMRIGRGRRSERFPGEVVYYAAKDDRIPNVFSGDAEREVPRAYGFASPVTMDAHGGWIGSAIDLMRFVTGFDGLRGRGLLTPAMRSLMLARPAPPLGLTPEGRPADAYYACGWSVRPVSEQGGANIWHMGGMAGTSSILVRLANGTCWAALFNRDAGGDELDGMLHRGAHGVHSWPAGDLFPRFA
jgi:N-acyl-D-amino-acid deacylase